MEDYHGRMMNLQIDKQQAAFADRAPKEILAYKAGHRDARHAAAKIACEADRRIEAAEGLAHWVNRLLAELPQKRDWLDPEIEANLREWAKDVKKLDL